MTIAPVTITRLENLLYDHAKWSQIQFGSDAERGPVGPLKHLAKEALEASEEPTDLIEYADCFLLLMDAMRRGKFTLAQLVDASAKKLEMNKLRNWPKTSPTEPVLHIK